MRNRTVLLLFVTACALQADNLEKTQKKALETQVKTMTGEAKKLEKLGQLAEARAKYAASQALIEMKEVTDALKRVDDEIHKRVKEALNQSRKLYETKKFNEAAAALDASMKLETFQAVLSYNLALCYYQLGDRPKALEYLAKAKPGTVDPKQKEKLQQLLTHVTTGENSFAMNDSEKDRIIRVNLLADSIGLDASLEDDNGSEESFFDGDPVQPETVAAKPTAPKADRPAVSRSDSKAGHRSSLCNALGELKTTLAKSPSATFNLANCAESNGRTAEASTLLERYLEMAPKALDAEESRARIVELKELLSVPGRNGAEIRRLYASAYSALSERQYDRAFAAFTSAEALAPDFAPTSWKLALLYEATGNVDKARQNFLRYQQLTPDQSAKDEAALHLSTLDAKRAKYDEEVDAAGDVMADLFNRSLKLAFNGSEKRSALRSKRAQVKKKNDQAKARNRVGGFAIPFAYAQQQLGEASGHLQIALALFPLGAEANQLMGLVFLQANDGRSAIKSFDAVASQGLPVAFYAEMRGKKQDRAVKVELNRNGLRLIYLSSYDKKGNPAPPSKPAGEDGLGDMVIDPSVPRIQEFEALNLTSSQIKKVETDKGVIKVKLTDQEITLSPIYVPTFTPVEGPQARRFANSYTRLFVRYPGLEDSKLGTEGMSGGEKFKMGYNLASAGFDMATSGFSVIGAISSVQDAISITRTIRAAVVSLSLSFATWEKSVNDQQQLLAGKAFKSILVQPVNLAFAQDIK